MKKIMIEESLYEFAKRGRPRKTVDTNNLVLKHRGINSPDKWESEDDEEIVNPEELNVDTTDMETAEELDIEEVDVFDDELYKALSNEVNIPEFSRRTLEFKLKGDREQNYSGIPMAKLGDNAFLFKLKDGKMKKIFLKDIIVENENKSNRAKLVFEGYVEEDEGREEFARQMEEDHVFLSDDEEDEDHNCLDYVNKYGQCQMCGKWHTPNEDDLI